MNIQKISAILALTFLALSPLRVVAQDRPITLVTSSSKNAPVAGRNYKSIGYWDVDDYDGNGGGSAWSLSFMPFKFDTSNHVASQSTCSLGGHYMATLAINPRSLAQISNLKLFATSAWKTEIANYSYSRDGNCTVMSGDNGTSYVVGWWDVDGGGGQGSDGSSGSRAMALVAEYGSSSSSRQLLDLQLVASDRKTPASKTGYQIVGYWDVDKGGSRGTDGSTGHYMMTLLAKWSR